jgi:DNA-binding MurR/RpiR family transcriptional regulator
METLDRTYLRQGADLFDRIRGASDKFTPSFRKVAEYVVAHTHDVAFSPAARVAASAGVSESVVVRFAGELGYRGYPGMQEAAQAFVRSQLQGPSVRFERLTITPSSAPLDIFRSIFLQDVENLHTTVDHAANHGAFAQALEALLGARRIYICGFRGLRSLAELSAFLLDMAGCEAVLITHGDASGFQTASSIRKGDVLVAFAFSRYTHATTALVQMARRREATTIVITDSVMAPAARKADHVLQTVVTSPSFFNSYTAAVSCINALLVAFSVKARARVSRRLREVDDALPQNEFEIASVPLVPPLQSARGRRASS